MTGRTIIQMTLGAIAVVAIAVPLTSGFASAQQTRQRGNNGGYAGNGGASGLAQGPSALAADGGYLFVVRNNQIYKVSESTLQVVQMNTLSSGVNNGMMNGNPTGVGTSGNYGSDAGMSTGGTMNSNGGNGSNGSTGGTASGGTTGTTGTGTTGATGSSAGGGSGTGTGTAGTGGAGTGH